MILPSLKFFIAFTKTPQRVGHVHNEHAPIIRFRKSAAKQHKFTLVKSSSFDLFNQNYPDNKIDYTCLQESFFGAGPASLEYY